MEREGLGDGAAFVIEDEEQRSEWVQSTPEEDVLIRAALANQLRINAERAAGNQAMAYDENRPTVLAHRGRLQVIRVDGTLLVAPAPRKRNGKGERQFVILPAHDGARTSLLNRSLIGSLPLDWSMRTIEQQGIDLARPDVVAAAGAMSEVFVQGNGVNEWVLGNAAHQEIVRQYLRIMVATNNMVSYVAPGGFEHIVTYAPPEEVDPEIAVYQLFRRSDYSLWIASATSRRRGRFHALRRIVYAPPLTGPL